MRPLNSKASAGQANIAHFNTSWTVRVRRDDLLTHSRSTAPKQRRRSASRMLLATARPPRRARTWKLDIKQPETIFRRLAASSAPATGAFATPRFADQWEMLLASHVCLDAPIPYDLREGAKAYQLRTRHPSWRDAAAPMFPRFRRKGFVDEARLVGTLLAMSLCEFDSIEGHGKQCPYESCFVDET
jgi:hypothetical protein